MVLERAVAFRQRAEKNRSSAADEEAKIVAQTALGYIPGPEEIADSATSVTPSAGRTS